MNIQVASSVTATSSAAPSDLIGLLLSSMRVGVMRARLLENEILATGISLKSGLLDPDHAVSHLADVGALHLCGLSS
jgi:hypothetical protein